MLFSLSVVPSLLPLTTEVFLFLKMNYQKKKKDKISFFIPLSLFHSVMTGFFPHCLFSDNSSEMIVAS